jgi:hypothetical protein
MLSVRILLFGGYPNCAKPFERRLRCHRNSVDDVPKEIVDITTQLRCEGQNGRSSSASSLRADSYRKEASALFAVTLKPSYIRCFSRFFQLNRKIEFTMMTALVHRSLERRWTCNLGLEGRVSDADVQRIPSRDASMGHLHASRQNV